MLLESRRDCWDYYLFCEKGFQTLKLNWMLTRCSILSSSQMTILVSWNISGFIHVQTVCYRIFSLCRRDLVYFYGQQSTSLYWSTYRSIYTFVFIFDGSSPFVLQKFFLIRTLILKRSTTALNSLMILLIQLVSRYNSSIVHTFVFYFC